VGEPTPGGAANLSSELHMIFLRNSDRTLRIATALSMGDFGGAAYDDLIGSDAIFVAPLEYLLMGAGASL
jgi:hypothetical protein